MVTKIDIEELVKRAKPSEIANPYKIDGKVDWLNIYDAVKVAKPNDILIVKCGNLYGEPQYSYYWGLFRGYSGGMVHLSNDFSDTTNHSIAPEIVEGILNLGNIKNHLVDEE